MANHMNTRTLFLRTLTLPVLAASVALAAGCDGVEESDEPVSIDAEGEPFDVLDGGFEPMTAAEEEDEVEERIYASSPTIWDKLSIPVCWESFPADQATQRFWVKSQVEATWESVTYVDFTGWGACLPGSKGIRIVVSDVGPHVDKLGSALDGLMGGMTLNFTFFNWSQGCQLTSELCIRAIATHEFGHALGFAHEQNRADTPAACALVQAPQGPNGDITLGAWDINSTMNYCNAVWNMNGALSTTDIEAARQFYGSSAYASLRRDAVDLGNGKILFFNGNKFVRYDKALDRMESGYPKTMAGNIGNWPASFTYVDAATRIGTKVYLFNQGNYARYDVPTGVIDQQPKPIVGNWTNWPVSGWTSIDAALDFGNGKIFFFKGSQYIRFDIAADKVDQAAKSISVGWPGLYTSGIEYALNYGAKAYIFKGKQYQRIDVASNGTVDPGYPVNIAGNWVGFTF